VNITPLGQNLLLSMDKFNVGARFANKIWNASRYILMNIEGIRIENPNTEALDTVDRWILTRFEETVQSAGKALEEYRLNDTSALLYEFFWHEFCDWYIEISKIKLYSQDETLCSQAASMLVRVLDGCMRLLHPIMPFITEEIWQLLPLKRDKKSIMHADYPLYDAKNVFPESREPMQALKELNYAIRNIRGEMNVPPELEAEVLIKVKKESVRQVIEEQRDVIRFLSKLKKIVFGGDIEKPPASAFAVGDGYEIYLPLKGLIDIEMEKARLSKELTRLTVDIERSEHKLKNESFLRKAPREVVEKERERLSISEKARERVHGILQSL
jgi:valyl-tRNA synthetase